MFHSRARRFNNVKIPNITRKYVSDRNIYPDLKIINASTGIISNSLNEEKKRKELEQNGLDSSNGEFANDPYFALLDGLRLMHDFFKTSTYSIITTPLSVTTLEDIKKGFYTDDKIELRIDGEVYSFSNEMRITVSLLEIIRIISFGGPVSLVDKQDTRRLYDELVKTITLADPENKLSYNKLPHDKMVVEKMIELKNHLEQNESWIFYLPETPVINFTSQAFGSLYELINGMNIYSEKNKQINTNEEIDLNHVHKYKKRT